VQQLGYSVTVWGSHPDEGNDDAWEGRDYATLAEAEAAFRDPVPVFGRDAANAVVTLERRDDSTGYLEVLPAAPYPGYSASRRAAADREADREWRREIATQAGMAGGCAAYNDAMGCGHE